LRDFTNTNLLIHIWSPGEGREWMQDMSGIYAFWSWWTWCINELYLECHNIIFSAFCFVLIYLVQKKT
jgi:hypothetical protein